MGTAPLGELHYKANMFKVLGELYKKPNLDHLGYMDHLIEAVEELYPELTGKAEDLANELEGHNLSDAESKLVVDYAKLFIGPFDLHAPPYGSIYLDDGRRLMGDTTKEVEAMYQKAGLEKLNVIHEPADHITVELEFVYYLYFQYIETGELKYLELMQEFMQRYLITWMFQFTKKIRNEAKQSYYQKLARLSEEIIEREAKQFELQT